MEWLCVEKWLSASRFLHGRCHELMQRQLAVKSHHDIAVQTGTLSAFAYMRDTYAPDCVRESGCEPLPPLCAGPRSGPDIAGAKAPRNLQKST
jgi:hypothetical protein